MNERPGPNASYWLAGAIGSLPPHAYLEWLASQGLLQNMLAPQQEQGPPPTFPVNPGGTNALRMPRGRQPMAFNALAGYR